MIPVNWLTDYNNIVITQVLERAHCLSTMEAINEAGWYKSYIKPNAAAVVVLRILTALKEDEPKLAVSRPKSLSLSVLAPQQPLYFSHSLIILLLHLVLISLIPPPPDPASEGSPGASPLSVEEFWTC